MATHAKFSGAINVPSASPTTVASADMLRSGVHLYNDSSVTMYWKFRTARGNETVANTGTDKGFPLAAGAYLFISAGSDHDMIAGDLIVIANAGTTNQLLALVY